MKRTLAKWLFETSAVKVSPEKKPYWYTSGMIGPYYINTHYLYGSQTKAEKLLEVIDTEKENKVTCPEKIKALTLKNAQTDNIFRSLMDMMTAYIQGNIDVEKIDYVSGGERRDWFFSYVIAEKLNKPHITIYKDLSTYVTTSGGTEKAKRIDGANVLHIADLITAASSYERAWIPAIEKLGAKIQWSVVVVDRQQGGKELLERYDVKSFALTNIDENLFENALLDDYIDKKQFKLVKEYIENPFAAMQGFLKNNPEFLKAALNGDEKTQQRAELCIKQDLYKLQ